MRYFPIEQLLKLVFFSRDIVASRFLAPLLLRTFLSGSSQDWQELLTQLAVANDTSRSIHRQVTVGAPHLLVRQTVGLERFEGSKQVISSIEFI